MLVKILDQMDTKERAEIIRYLQELALHLPINHIYQKMSESPSDINQEIPDQNLFSSILEKVF